MANSSNQSSRVQELLEAAEANIRAARQLLGGSSNGSSSKAQKSAILQKASELETHDDEDDKIIEGVFDGTVMIDNTKKQYPIPANYASKSKLIPGDVLKLTIRPDGSFLYKQIGPVDRKRIIGTLTYEDGQYKVIAEGSAYKVLLASVTYFKAEIGDNITLIVPENEESEWGAIENVLPKGANEDYEISEE